MSEQADNTTEQDEPSRKKEPEPKPGSYYYDDATGYEIYDPAKDEDSDDEDLEDEPEETRQQP